MVDGFTISGKNQVTKTNLRQLRTRVTAAIKFVWIPLKQRTLKIIGKWLINSWKPEFSY